MVPIAGMRPRRRQAILDSAQVRVRVPASRNLQLRGRVPRGVWSFPGGDVRRRSRAESLSLDCPRTPSIEPIRFLGHVSPMASPTWKRSVQNRYVHSHYVGIYSATARKRQRAPGQLMPGAQLVAMLSAWPPSWQPSLLQLSSQRSASLPPSWRRRPWRWATAWSSASTAPCSRSWRLQRAP
jgi:hypothetical protein